MFGKKSTGNVGGSVFRIKPFEYIHVADNNLGTTEVVVGPRTFTRQEHQKVVSGPEAMVIVPPRSYCIISNPVQRDAEGKPQKNAHGNYKLSHGDEEIRFHQDPFPLYPGEKLFGSVNSLQIVGADSALRLRCIRDFTSEDGVKHVAGDEWLFLGPGTYMPRIEVQVAEVVRATVLRPHQGLRLRARQECVDKDGNKRRAGEEWIWVGVGAYLPNVDEEILKVVDAYMLTEKQALHVTATRSFTDKFGKARKAGEEWLVTNKDAVSYIPGVDEQVKGKINITILSRRQYCVILDPLGDGGKPQLGKKLLVKGEASFFLRPGERLERGIQNVYVLGGQEALLLRAKEEYTDNAKEVHQPGDRWMIHGPCDYIPDVEVEIIEKRRSIPLSENEGIYIRDIKTGRVRSNIGNSYMLKANEELWEKDLPSTVEQLIQKQSGTNEARDHTRVVSLRVPHNQAVQIYDYCNKQSRVVFGPTLEMLGSDEHFTVLSLSGGKPKRPHMIKDLCLQLGPDFMTDIVTVETSDHARLQLKLSYNWKFEVKSTDADAAKIFQVPDFVGDSCKAIASRVRGAVAAVAFDNFHRNSARIIRSAVFGQDAAGKVLDAFRFAANGLVITNIDIQSVEPVDQRTRDSLQKSVQLAIEIATKSQEATARHQAERTEQEARGRLERQKIHDEAEAEKARRELLQLQADCAAVESTGQAKAEAKGRSEAAKIEGEGAVKMAEFKANTTKIEGDVALQTRTARGELELAHLMAIDDIEVNYARSVAEIESSKFAQLVKTIGPDTLASIAQAGPEMQAKLLQGLGIETLMVTDGNTPINLFNTAEGLISNATAAH